MPSDQTRDPVASEASGLILPSTPRVSDSSDFADDRSAANRPRSASRPRVIRTLVPVAALAADGEDASGGDADEAKAPSRQKTTRKKTSGSKKKTTTKKTSKKTKKKTTTRTSKKKTTTKKTAKSSKVGRSRVTKLTREEAQAGVAAAAAEDAAIESSEMDAVVEAGSADDAPAPPRGRGRRGAAATRSVDTVVDHDDEPDLEDIASPFEDEPMPSADAHDDDFDDEDDDDALAVADADDHDEDEADEDEADEADESEAEASDDDDEESRPRKKRRRRRRKGSGSADAESGSGESRDGGRDRSRGGRGGEGRGDSRGGSGGSGGRGGRSGNRYGNTSEVEAVAPDPNADEVMVINDSPGDECRIAILEKGHLEELFVERAATATNVGNIYKGRVVNVEPAIQAAFVDYGEGANGFLHISDLHPRYFPGSGNKERVGKKTPRRERPAIQDALKRGQEVLVQVLKQGIGSKGPTLTSYLSIPGRLLVMMPEMDRVGVSRKVEDEDARREMRKILDAIDLPEGFGFILRTAGIGRTRTDIRRDVAYLTRLWSQIQKRIDKVGAPCPLYTESDLVIRTSRDVLRPSIKAVIVDSESAYERLSAFLKVVAPRSAPRLIRYTRNTPVFHAFGVERQIDLIHSREVPLPSGGALVIEQTEALVAIDVNSGRSRSARDSETNAYRTNCEAVDEICRQLRLRDLGGLVVNDLIDMRYTRHRKAIEDRFRDNLKRDRARTSVSRISEFGLMEMTRQRMRPSIRSGHFTPCATCAGRGEVHAPDALGSEVARQIAFLFDQARVKRVEIVCSPRVASVLLSRKRRELVDMEDECDKRVDVRVSDDIPVDRVDYYAYDERNADLDLNMFRARKAPRLDDLEREAERVAVQVDVDADDDAGSDEDANGKRRRRRRRRSGPADATAIALSDGLEQELAAIEADEAMEDEDGEESSGRGRGRGSGRGRGRGRGRDRDELAETDAEGGGSDGDRASRPEVESGDDQGESEGGGRKRRRRRRRRRGGGEDGEMAEGGERRDERDDRESRDEPAAAASAAPVVELPPAEAMQVFKLAKELGLKSREVIDQAVEMGIEVQNHMNRLEADDVQRLRAHYAPAPEPVAVADPPARDADEDDADDGAERSSSEPRSEDTDDDDEGSRRKRRRRRRRRRRDGDEEGSGGDGDTERSADRGSERSSNGRDDEASGGSGDGESTEGGGRGRGRRRGRGRGGDGGEDRGGRGERDGRGDRDGREERAPRAASSAETKETPPKSGGDVEPAAKPKRRSLYRNRKPVSRATIESAGA